MPFLLFRANWWFAGSQQRLCKAFLSDAQLPLLNFL